MELNDNQREEIAVKNLRTASISSAALSIAKLAAGIIGGSSALIADGVHSCADVMSSAGIMMDVKKKDKSGRVRSIFLLCMGLAVCGAALVFIISSMRKLSGGEFTKYTKPALVTVIVAAVSIAVKEAMFRMTKRDAQKAESDALMADAWCHRSDALSSVAALIGIIAARNGAGFMDTAACLFVSLFLLRDGFDMAEEAVGLILNKPVSPELISRIEESVRKEERAEITEIEYVCRDGELFVEISITADGSISLAEAQSMAKELDERIESEFSEITECVVNISAGAGA